MGHKIGGICVLFGMVVHTVHFPLVASTQDPLVFNMCCSEMNYITVGSPIICHTVMWHDMLAVGSLVPCSCRIYPSVWWDISKRLWGTSTGNSQAFHYLSTVSWCGNWPIPMGAINDTLSSGCSISLLVLHITPFLVTYPSTVVMLLTVSDCVCLDDCGSDSLF